MSDVARQARSLLVRVLPRERATVPPPAAEIEAVLTELNHLKPADVHDEAALHECAEIALRLREAARARSARPARDA